MPLSKCLTWGFLLLSFMHTRGQSYFLNGNAQAIGDDCYQLTGMAGYQNGTVWYGNLLDLTQPFDIQFRMNFGYLDANGADGICFVLHTQGTTAIGQSGGGMGYQDFGTSVGIEFDTYQNGDSNDPVYDHVAIQRNGDINHIGPGNVAGPVQISPFSENVEDGEDHVAQIVWNPETTILSVYFDCVLRLQGTLDMIDAVFGGETEVWWGFTAATGGSFNNQTVCLQENILSVGDNVFICEGGSAVLSVGASLDGTYAWSPEENLDDPTSATPTASPEETTVYTCVYTDLCGSDQTAEIQVAVVPLEITMPEIGTIDCFTPNVVITPGISFTNNNQYAWTNAQNTAVGSGLSFIASSAGVYTLTANSNGECTTSESIEVIGDFSTLPANAGPNQTLTCVTDEVTLTATDAGDNAVYEWSGGNMNSNNTSITVDQAGTYVLQVQNPENGCISSDEVTVSLDITAPQIYIPAQDTLNCERRSLPVSGMEINGGGDYTFEWEALNPGIIQGSNTIINPVVAYPGIYEVNVVSNTNGCESNAMIEIYANEYFWLNPDELRFPNVISPNGDALNKGWRPFVQSNSQMAILDLFDIYNMKIYNRWGVLVEEIETPRAWLPDGLEDGIYYYYFDYSITCGETKTESIEGHIHLVR